MQLWLGIYRRNRTLDLNWHQETSRHVITHSSSHAVLPEQFLTINHKICFSCKTRRTMVVIYDHNLYHPNARKVRSESWCTDGVMLMYIGTMPRQRVHPSVYSMYRDHTITFYLLDSRSTEY